MDGTKPFVLLGYGEVKGTGRYSLEFITTELTADKASEVVESIGSYNEFNGRDVAAAIRRIGEIWASTKQQVTFEFGREGSPVLYIHIPDWLEAGGKLRGNIRVEKINHTIEIMKTIIDPENWTTC